MKTTLNKDIDTVIFDLDGTLLDTIEDLQGAINYVLTKHGYPAKSYQEVRAALGNGIGKLVEKTLPSDLLSSLSEAELANLVQDCKTYYEAHLQEHTKAFDGIYELLALLQSKGYHLAIVSNKIQEGVTALQKAFFASHITVAIGEQKEVKRKPAPDMVNEALRQLGATKDRAVYIGDSEVDLTTAQNAGLPCIAVTWGFRDESDLIAEGALHIARTPADIARLLKVE